MKPAKLISWASLSDTLTAKAGMDGSLDDIGRTEPDQKVFACYQIDYVRKCLEEWMQHLLEDGAGSKSRQKSRESRMQGNTNFTKSHKFLFLEALRLYNKSIIEAPHRSEELSIALGNRSAILFELKNYEKCLTDINLALENGYPVKLAYKLMMRKGKCLFYLKKYSEAIDVLEATKKDIDALSHIPSDRKAKLIQDIETGIKTAESLSKITSMKPEKLAPRCVADLVPYVASAVHPTFPSASDLLSLQYSEEKGKHVIAEKDIKMGDVLFVEKPYSHVLLQEHYESHCHNCCDMLSVPIPCWHCTYAIFCSLECQKEAWESYHKWECAKALRIFHSIGIAHLAIRVLLKASSDSSTENEEKYKRVNDLVTHFDKFSDRDMFQYTLIATLLLIYLEKKTDFFKTTNYTREKDFAKVGYLLLRHVVQLICNGHAITAIHSVCTDEENPAVTIQKPVRIATAIFPSASMMNHSCDPNISNSFFKDILIVKAIKDIPKGSEVYNCYGPDFRRMHVKYRKELLLDQYHFECNCEPCQTDTEEVSFLDRFYEGYLCIKCGGLSIPTNDSLIGKCTSCQSEQNCTKLHQLHIKAEGLYQKGCEFMKHKETETSIKLALECLLDAYSLYIRCHYKYHRDITECADQISRCYAILGDCDKSILYLEKTLPAVKEQFGPISIEYGHELQKLSDIMICDLQKLNGTHSQFKEKVVKTQDTLKELKIIFDIHYGLWNQQYRDLVDKEVELLNIIHALELLCISPSESVNNSSS